MTGSPRRDGGRFPEYVNCWLRFGKPDVKLDLDRRRSLSFFGSGRVFGFVRWIANIHGTQKWQLTVVQSVGSAWMLIRIKGVHPGGEIPLTASGQVKVKQVLSRIETLDD